MEVIKIFIGYDHRERAAINVLIDSLYHNSSLPVSITPIMLEQVKEVFQRERDPLQSTAFSFSRFLVPYLCNYQGWALFMDCDILCRSDIAKLWALRDNQYSIMCTKHEHIPNETLKFMGERQSAYPKKNWSSVMLFNCSRCQALTPEYVATASGLDLHRFHWLEGDHLIGGISLEWNHLVDVQTGGEDAAMLHWTLGGPWFNDQRKSSYSGEWFAARDAMSRLFDTLRSEDAEI